MKESSIPPSVTAMPFGKHRGKPLGEIPDGYLLWLLREAKLSSGLRLAVGNELRRRSVEAPPPPPPRRPPSCGYCGEVDFAVGWMEDSRGNRRIRATCKGCRRCRCFLPLIEPWVSAANANASPTAILDALTALDDLGVDLQGDGKKVWFAGDDYRRVPASLQAVVRQCSHQLASMIGRTI